MEQVKTKNVRVDERLHKRAKIFASQRGMSMGQLAEVGIALLISKMKEANTLSTRTRLTNGYNKGMKKPYYVEAQQIGGEIRDGQWVNPKKAEVEKEHDDEI